MSIKIKVSPVDIRIKILPGGDFHKDLDRIKSIPGREFDKVTKKDWIVGREAFEEIQSKWRKDEIFFADNKSEQELKKVQNQDKRPLVQLPPIEREVAGSLYPLKDYQKTYVVLNEKVTKAILSLPCGAGKTLTSIERIKMLNDVGSVSSDRILIVCPKRIRENWQTNIRLMMGRESLIYWGSKKQREKLRKIVPEHNIIICTYQTAYELHDLMKLNYTQIIIDECHLACHKSTQRFKAVELVVSQNPDAGLQLLSGTPIQDKPSDLWGPLHFVSPTTAGAEQTWKNKYERVVSSFKKKFPRKARGGGLLRNASGEIVYYTKEIPLKTVYQNLDKMSNVVAPFIYRVSKEEAFTDFEYPIEPIFLDMSKDQWKLYNKVKDQILVELDEGIITVDQAIVKTLRLTEICEGNFNLNPNGSSSKFDYCTELMKELKEEELLEGKCIFWSRFKEITYKLQKAEPEELVVFNGDMPDYMLKLAEQAFNGVRDKIELQTYLERQKRAEKAGYYFPWGPGEARFFAGTMNILSSLGIDLHQYCYRQVTTSLDWTGATIEQTLARLIRLGQKKSFIYTNPLLIKGTAESLQFQKLLEKNIINNTILDGKGSKEVLSNKEIINLLYDT